MLRGLPWSVFVYWSAFFELQPWGEHRKDLRNAVNVWSNLAAYLPRYHARPNVEWPYWEPGPDAALEDQAAVDASNDWYRNRKHGQEQSDIGPIG